MEFLTNRVSELFLNGTNWVRVRQGTLFADLSRLVIEESRVSVNSKENENGLYMQNENHSGGRHIVVVYANLFPPFIICQLRFQSIKSISLDVEC